GAGGPRLAVGGAEEAAAGPAPLEAGGAEDLVEALALAVALPLLRAGDDPGGHAVRDPPAARERGGLAQIGQARVRAGADEHPVDLRAPQAAAGPAAHVRQRARP